MTDYSNGKIYKLSCSNESDDFYIGSTVQSLDCRQDGHKKDMERQPERRVYEHFNRIGADAMCMELIEEFPCSNAEELRAREQYWIDTLKPSLNTARAARATPKSKTVCKSAWLKSKIRNYYKTKAVMNS